MCWSECSVIIATDEVVTESTLNKLEQMEKQLAKGLGVPEWGLVAILIGNKVIFDECDPNQLRIIDPYSVKRF